jgi:hypothetical protein
VVADNSGNIYIADKPTISDPHPMMYVTPESLTEPIVLTIYPQISKIGPLGENYYDIITNQPITRLITDYEVIYEVKSWKLDGNPAGNVVFTWLFTAEVALAERNV